MDRCSAWMRLLRLRGRREEVLHGRRADLWEEVEDVLVAHGATQVGDVFSEADLEDLAQRHGLVWTDDGQLDLADEV
jgi:hypothetical protein